MNKKFALTLFILLGLLLGILVGQLLHDPQWTPASADAAHRYADWLQVLHFLGFTVFMGLLKMLIIPLIAVSVVVGITSVGDFRKLGRMGGWTLVYYATTMLIAVTVGLVVVNVINPGAGIAETELSQVQTSVDSAQQQELSEKSAGGLTGVFENLFTLMIPTNIVKAMAEGQTLSVITFSIFFAVVVTLIGVKGEPVVRLFQGLFEVFMRMVEVVLWLAPVGVFSLLAWTIARIGLGVFGESIGLYMIAVLLGLMIHALVVLPVVCLLFARTNPFLFLKQAKEALMMAFATDSSSATLPVTLEVATREAGISKKAAGLVLPLGSTINMDGTALYEAVAVVFMAQAFGVELGLAQMVLVAVTATLAAVGAAGIPSAGLVTMLIVVEATNKSLLAANPEAAVIPLAGIGLIIGVDRILDMFRTVVNVWGDLVGAKIISRLE